MELVAAQKQVWRRDHHRGRRPAVWSPGEHLVIDWGAEGGLHVFCAVLAWCRFRFVRFAADERAEMAEIKAQQDADWTLKRSGQEGISHPQLSYSSKGM